MWRCKEGEKLYPITPLLSKKAFEKKINILQCKALWVMGPYIFLDFVLASHTRYEGAKAMNWKIQRLSLCGLWRQTKIKQLTCCCAGGPGNISRNPSTSSDLSLKTTDLLHSLKTRASGTECAVVWHVVVRWHILRQQLPARPNKLISLCKWIVQEHWGRKEKKEGGAQSSNTKVCSSGHRGNKIILCFSNICFQLQSALTFCRTVYFQQHIELPETRKVPPPWLLFPSENVC